MSMTQRRWPAFTLVEILVVVTILGIISAIVLPELGTRNDLKATATARALMADLLYTQNRAIAMQKIHYISFNAAANKYDVYDVISPAHLITQPVLQTPYEVTLGTGNLQNVSISSASFDGQTVLAFDELGAPFSYNTSTSAMTGLLSGSVAIKCGANIVTVAVGPYSGEIKVQ